jgi:hypothetical protein
MDTWTIDGNSYERERWNQTFPCHDCLATKGNLHSLDCDVERCPRCGGQAISCDCDIVEIRQFKQADN